jgi:flagella basal body P-ring formation protein FlgA
VRGIALALALASLAAPLRAEPPRVVAEASERPIDPAWLGERLVAAIRHRMPWPEHAVRFAETRLPPAFSVPAHAQRLRLRFSPREDFAGWVEGVFEFVDPQEGRVALTRSASARLEVELPVPVLAFDLRRGGPLEGALTLETREISGLPADRVASIDALRGARLAQALPAGTPLRWVHVDAPELVRHGDALEVRVARPGLEVVLAARALERGKLGQVIDAENRGTRRRFPVVITGPGEAALLEPGVGSAP